MSGVGIVSIRLPRSVLKAFEANALRAGVDKHEAARRLVLALEQLTDDQLADLPEPPKESDNPRLSLYLGWPYAEIPATVSRRTQLSISCIVRRLVYGLVVTGAIKAVQTKHVNELNLVPVQQSTEESNCCSYAGIIFLAMLVIAVTGIMVRYQRIRTRRTKPKMVSHKPIPSLGETPEGANPQ